MKFNKKVGSIGLLTTLLGTLAVIFLAIQLSNLVRPRAKPLPPATLSGGPVPKEAFSLQRHSIEFAEARGMTSRLKIARQTKLKTAPKSP